MKSQLRNMLRIWRAASLDATLACALPSLEGDRDFRSLERVALTRGVGVFLLDLPTLDEHLLFILEHGFSRFSGPFTARRSKSDLRPKFLWGFWSQVIDEKGLLLRDASPDAMLAIRQLSKGLSKLEVQCTVPRLEKSIQEFNDIEDSILLPNESWNEDDFKFATDSTLDHFVRSLPIDRYLRTGECDKSVLSAFARRFDRIAGILVSELGIFDSMSDDGPDTGFFKHGPGAVSNLSGRKYKYSFPSWSEKLEGVFPFDWCSGSPLGSFPASQVEAPGRLLAVPKTAKGPRLIASEPLEHQWCQQKIASWLAYGYDRTRIGRFIALRSQLLSQELVASASHDRSLSTIDLSSASDRIATWHIEALLRVNPELVRAVHAVRTRTIDDRVLMSGIRPLRKFTTMGSALTFPVQSLFFLVIALASCGASTPKDIDRLIGKVRVFGDDIIVPTTAYATVVTNLEALGLKVNVKKSFTNGFFRESCGADYWNGYNITPVKPKVITPDTATDVQAILDSSNNFHFRGYWKTAKEFARNLPSTIRRGLVTVVNSIHPFLVNGKKRNYDDSAVPALHSFSECYVPAKRWNHDLQRWDVRITALSSKVKKETQDHSASLREFLTRPWREFFPRETGVARNLVANLATRWVGFPDGNLGYTSER